MAEIDMSRVETLVRQIFPRRPVQVERMMEGVSTFVYQITYQLEPFLPKDGHAKRNH